MQDFSVAYGLLSQDVTFIRSTLLIVYGHKTDTNEKRRTLLLPCQTATMRTPGRRECVTCRNIYKVFPVSPNGHVSGKFSR